MEEDNESILTPELRRKHMQEAIDEVKSWPQWKRDEIRHYLGIPREFDNWLKTQ